MKKAKAGKKQSNNHVLRISNIFLTFLSEYKTFAHDKENYKIIIKSNKKKIKKKIQVCMHSICVYFL